MNVFFVGITVLRPAVGSGLTVSESTSVECSEKGSKTGGAVEVCYPSLPSTGSRLMFCSECRAEFRPLPIVLLFAALAFSGCAGEQPVPITNGQGEMAGEVTADSVNCLKRAKIQTVAQLVIRTESDLLRVRNLGRRHLNELKEVLAGMAGW